METNSVELSFIKFFLPEIEPFFYLVTQHFNDLPYPQLYRGYRLNSGSRRVLYMQLSQTSFQFVMDETTPPPPKKWKLQYFIKYCEHTLYKYTVYNMHLYAKHHFQIGMDSVLSIRYRSLATINIMLQ
jgi:hypothetical protein